MAKALVIIPTYNEAGNIGQIVPQVLAQDPGIDVLVVDDNSPDGTARIVRELASRDSRVHLIEREKKMGLGTAYVAGFKFAVERNYEYMFEMDSDFSHDPADLPRFLSAIADHDLVIGSRYVGGVRVLDWPMQRLLLSYFANVYTRFLTRMPVYDATGGFKCYRSSAIQSIDLDGIRSNGYAFQIEISYKLWKKGYRLTEIPIVFHERMVGTSKMSRQIVHEAFFKLLDLFFRNLVHRL